MKLRQILSIIAIIAIVGGLISAAAKLITFRLFWVIAIICTGYAWLILPRLKSD